MKNIYYFIFAGLLLAFSFPPFPLFPLAFISFAVLILGIEKELKEKNPRYFTKFYLTFFIYHLMSNWWISSFQENTDPFLMIAGFALDLFHPFFFLIPMYTYIFIRKNLSKHQSLLAFPIIWVSWEYFHSIGELSYPWLAVGNTQINNIFFVQIADLFGLYGISFIIVLINVLIYLILDTFVTEKIIQKSYIIALSTILLSVYIYGYIQFNKFSNDKFNDYEKISISVIQPNLDPWSKWASGPLAQIVQNLDLQDSLNLIKKADLSVWPETSILRINEDFNKHLKLSFIENWSKLNNTSILSGIVYDYEYKNNEKHQPSARFDLLDSVWEESYNAAVIINPSGKHKDVYFKSKLTPFAERIPNLEYFSFLSDILKWNVGESSWGLGKNISNLVYSKDGKNYQIAPIICIESIYPDFCRKFTNKGANVLTIITNDAWYNGTPGPVQHFNIARMRAIENRRFIARSANSGISGFIAPNGEILKSTENMVKGGITLDIPILNDQSIFVILGNIICEVLLILTIFSCLSIAIFKRYKK